MSEDRLYGLPNAEFMERDLDAIVENWIDVWSEAEPFVIEEWSCTNASAVLPIASDLTTYIIERWCDETTEDCYESWENASQHADALSAFQAALDLLGSKVTYRMADRKLKDHHITFDADGEPLDDGTPVYSKATKPS